MRKILSLIILTAILALLSFDIPIVNADLNGEELIKMKEFSRAINVLKKRKQTPEVCFSLGTAYYELGEFENASASFREAAAKTLDISNPDSFFISSTGKREFWCKAALKEAISRLRATKCDEEEVKGLVDDCTFILSSLAKYSEFVGLVFDVAQLCENEELSNKALEILKKDFPTNPRIYDALKDEFVSAIIIKDLVEAKKRIAELLPKAGETDIAGYLYAVKVKLEMNEKALAEGDELLTKENAVKQLVEDGFNSENPYKLMYIASLLHDFGDFLGEITLAVRMQKILKGMKQPDWLVDERMWNGDYATMWARSWYNVASGQLSREEFAEAQETLDQFFKSEENVDQFDPRSMLEADYFKRGIAGMARILQAELYVRRSDKFNATVKLCEAMRYMDSQKKVVTMAEEVFRKLSPDPDTKLSSVAAIFDNTERFREVTEQLLPKDTSGSRIAMCDVNCDGIEDLLISGSKAKLLVMKDGIYQDLTEKMEIPQTRIQGGVFADYNRDGYADLFLFGDEKCYLLRNEQGYKFTDVTEQSGIKAADLSTHSACWGDFTGDGLYDLYICNRPKVFHSGHGLTPAYSPDQLFSNNGDGTFSDSSSMLDSYVSRYSGRGVAPCDFDRDGNLDLFVTNYSLHPNTFYRNLGVDGLKNIGWETETAGLESELPVESYYAHSIGAIWADFDNNSKPDLFAPNFAHPRVINISDRSWVFMNYCRGDMIRLSPKRLIPFNETLAVPAKADFDGDGDMDIYLTATYADRPCHMYQNLYKEKGKVLFKDVAFSSGSLTFNGWGCTFHDFDGDADPDLFVCSNGKLRIFENQAKANFIKVRYRTPGVGFGTEVWVYDKDGKRSFTLNGAKGSGDQDAMEICIGMGFQKQADKIVVCYKDNKIAFENIKSRSTVEVDFNLFED